nr:hypothetical protein [Tanacetum cinerariifolium]
MNSPFGVLIHRVIKCTSFKDYTPTSPDYFSASPRNTSPGSSNNLTKDLLASLAFFPFYNDPYIKVIHAYDVTNNELPILPQAPIAPPTILPPSPMLSPSLNSGDFFPPEEILPPKKRAHGRSSSSTSSLPRVFENGESSHKTSLERHEEQIEDILNHLDELSLDCIEHMEDKIKGLGHDDGIVLSRVRTSTLEMIIEDIQVHHQSDKKNILDAIDELKNRKKGSPDY